MPTTYLNIDSFSNPVVLFDGECVLCNYSVNFLLNNNTKENLLFTNLQSKAAKSLLKTYGLEEKKFDSIVLIELDKVYIKSAASFQICTHLPYPYKALTIFKYFPLQITDRIYELIARNRYKWFGKKEKCMEQKKKWKDRFL